jgi:hypothetical protein
MAQFLGPVHPGLGDVIDHFGNCPFAGEGAQPCFGCATAAMAFSCTWAPRWSLGAAYGRR